MRTLLLPLLLAAPLALGVPAAAQATGPATASAAITPAKVYPAVAPCTTGTGPSDFTVSGGDFQPHEVVTVTVGGVVYDTFRATGMGTYAHTFGVRPTPSGIYDVLVEGGAGSAATGSVTIGYSGCRSVRNGKLRITGAGFRSAGAVELALAGAVTTRPTDVTGRFDFTVPCPSGRHTARITDDELRVLAFTGFTC